MTIALIGSETCNINGGVEVKRLTLREEIVEAIEEAKILECAREKYEESHMLFIAQKLSGAPFSFVKQIYLDMQPKLEIA